MASKHCSVRAQGLPTEFFTSLVMVAAEDHHPVCLMFPTQRSWPVAELGGSSWETRSLLVRGLASPSWALANRLFLEWPCGLRLFLPCSLGLSPPHPRPSERPDSSLSLPWLHSYFLSRHLPPKSFTQLIPLWYLLLRGPELTWSYTF